MTAPTPPPQVEPYIEIIGHDAALDLVKAFGGVRVYVPKDPPADSPVVKAIGMAAAVRLAAALGGESPRIPVARAWLVQHYASLQWPVPRIARELRIADFSVRRILERQGGRQVDERQTSLF
ncbi:hypothetical protein [Inquilinus sp. CA228]|uniref:hypothetical protein n=1 Tax=Inquilinus sp. CA228 TaxID=3455609 RepID=UPI003F8CFD42